MKSLLFLLLPISLCTCFLTSCEKESSEPYAFEGEWIWVETTSGWGPQLNPDKLGHSISLIIDHSKYTMLVDNVISNEWTYEYKTSTSPSGTISESILLETNVQYFITVDSVNLELWDGWIDGDVWHYVRK
jgi:hypothetical protein